LRSPVCLLPLLPPPKDLLNKQVDAAEHEITAQTWLHLTLWPGYSYRTLPGQTNPVDVRNKFVVIRNSCALTVML